MIVLITGTPGTGKSSVAKLLAKRINVDVISIARTLDESVCAGYDTKRKSKIVDIKKLARKIKDIIRASRKRAKDIDIIIEGHLSHLLPFGDVVIVLRAHPKVLERRLKKKKYAKAKIAENLEAEALDVCLIESLERHKKVYEIDTTNKKPHEVASAIVGILEGKGEAYAPGKIDWSEEFF